LTFVTFSVLDADPFVAQLLIKGQVALVYVTVIKRKLASSNANCQYLLIFRLLIHLNTLKIRYNVLTFFPFHDFGYYRKCDVVCRRAAN